MLTDSGELEIAPIQCSLCLDFLDQGFAEGLDEKSVDLIFALTQLVLHPSSNLCQRCCSELHRISEFKELILSRQALLHHQPETDFYEKLEDHPAVTEHQSIEDQEQEFFVIQDVDESAKENVRTPKHKKLKNSEDYPDKRCPFCDKQFTEKRKIPLHIKRIHTKVRDFSCDKCDYSAYTRFDIVRHVKNVHTPQPDTPADRRICPQCGKVVRGNNQLTLHIRKKHLQIKKYQCDLCEFKSYGKYEIRSHLEHIHVPKEFKETFPCEICDSVLSSAMGLKVHVQHKHSGLKPYSCYCGKSFSLRETLKTHIRNVHKGERKFACTLCPKRFGQAVRLRDHMNNNHGTKQEYPCPHCNKIFHSSRNLKAHEIYHSEPKYECQECSRKFYLSNKLKEHSKSHQQIPAEHHCKLCPRTFQLLSSLKRHEKKHLKNHQ